MIVSKERLLSSAADTDFRPAMLEKVFYLLALLEDILAHPRLKGKLALKGGTALNLFVFDIPRLSIDIDLNYIAHANWGEMKADRPVVEEAIRSILKKHALPIKREAPDHAGGKWVIGYQSALGGTGNLQIDLNFLLRAPLWQVITTNSKSIASQQVLQVPVLDSHELFAGKLSALMSRQASRDLFDTFNLLTKTSFDFAKLRLALVIYGAMNPKDWRQCSPETIGYTVKEIKEKLLPLLRNNELKPSNDLAAWAEELLSTCIEKLNNFFPLAENETEFITQVREKGVIKPDLITDDQSLQDILATHPSLLWRATKARQ